MKTLPRIAVINYGMGNLRSVAKAVEAAGGDVQIVTKPTELDASDGVVLPGVGALADCVSALRETGMSEALRDWITADRPFLGVCLGLQALFDYSEEAETEGLGIFPCKVLRFRLPPELKVPHMGWNTVRFAQPESALIANLENEGEAFYFVHSYYVTANDRTLVTGSVDYGVCADAALARDNLFATQFHPEKSHTAGLQLLRNFINWTPAC